MAKQPLTAEQKRLENDLWIILLVTLGAFLSYAAMQNQIKSYITNSSISVIPRLLLNAGIQFGVAGLGITIVSAITAFNMFFFVRPNWYICYVFASGQFKGYQPLRILLTEDVITGGIPLSIFGMALIAVVWGFFEGFNYVVICEKINKRYPSKTQWLDYGAITCAIFCILFHPFSTSFWGIVEIITTCIAIYGMLIVKKNTGNAWGCVFAFCFIWNAL